jgi:electron transfer flavoprotein beta subunit
MNLLVVLRAVQDPAGLMVNRRAQKVFVNRVSYRLNPSDHNALEAALAAAGDTHTVTAVAYGGPPAEEVLRDALAMGAARAVWVREPALQTAEAAVLTGVLRCLAEYVGGADVLVFGADVLDADLAQVAPRLAAALEGAFIEPVHQIKIGTGTVQAIVAGGEGYRRVEAQRPVIAAVARDSNRPRYAPAGRIITAHSTPDALEVVTLADLGVSELTPLTEVRGETFPPEREMGVVMEGTEAETAARVAEALRGLRPKPTA